MEAIGFKYVIEQLANCPEIEEVVFLVEMVRNAVFQDCDQDLGRQPCDAHDGVNHSPCSMRRNVWDPELVDYVPQIDSYTVRRDVRHKLRIVSGHLVSPEWPRESGVDR